MRQQGGAATSALGEALERAGQEGRRADLAQALREAADQGLKQELADALRQVADVAGSRALPEEAKQALLQLARLPLSPKPAQLPRSSARPFGPSGLRAIADPIAAHEEILRWLSAVDARPSGDVTLLFSSLLDRVDQQGLAEVLKALPPDRLARILLVGDWERFDFVRESPALFRSVVSGPALLETRLAGLAADARIWVIGADAEILSALGRLASLQGRLEPIPLAAGGLSGFLFALGRALGLPLQTWNAQAYGRLAEAFHGRRLGEEA